MVMTRKTIRSVQAAAGRATGGLAVRVVAAVAIAAVMAGQAAAQPPGGGFGGPPGAPGGGFGGPEDFIRRLDANGNGMIDPGEVDGRFGFFIQRMAENNKNIDISKPIPISRLTEEMTKMRDQFGGGQPGGGRGESRGDSRGDSRGGQPGQDNNPYQPRATKVQTLVPGFGVEDVLTPAPGFGADAELFTVEVNDRDREEAARSYRYYDGNNDGIIDSEEMKRSRYGADLPLYDRNRDGKITMNEMEYRYARRRVENERDAGKTASSSSPRSSSSPSSNSGGEQGRGDQRFSRGGFGGFGGGFGGPGGGQPQEESRDRDDDREGGKDKDKKDSRKSYRIASATDKLPKGLPGWYTQGDANADAQISMSEFSTSWSDSVFDDFNKFDLNRDGIITVGECLAAVDDGAVRSSKAPTVVASSGGSSSRGFGSGSSPPGGSGSPQPPKNESPDNEPSAEGTSETATAPAESETATGAENTEPAKLEEAKPAPATTAPAVAAPAVAAPAVAAPAGVDPLTMNVATGMIKKYDANQDGFLTATEWMDMRRNPAAADTDGDGKVSATELAVHLSKS